MLKMKFGLTVDEYNDLLSVQGGKCAICRTRTDRQKQHMAVDHCHQTGKIRGILCSSCNKGIGHFKDNPTLLNRAIVYLTKR